MKAFEVFDNQRQIDVFGLPLSDIIGSLTLLIALWALLTSMRASRESARANTLTSLPILSLSYDYDKDEVLIENAGNGVAVNIRVDSFYNWWADKELELYGLSTLKFKKTSILKPTAKVILQTEIKGVVDPFQITKFVMFSNNQQPLDFSIRFSDLSGQRYWTRVEITKGDVEVALFPKQYGVIGHVHLGLLRIKESLVMSKYFFKVQYHKHTDHKKGKGE